MCGRPSHYPGAPSCTPSVPFPEAFSAVIAALSHTTHGSQVCTDGAFLAGLCTLAVSSLTAAPVPGTGHMIPPGKARKNATGSSHW